MTDGVRVPSDGARPNAFRAFYDWTGDRHVAAIGTNAGSIDLPFQDWRRFKEAFAPELIERAVRETKIPLSHIVDPFGGSGTTALAAQFLGIKSTTIEVNPFLSDLIEAKVAHHDMADVVRAFARVMDKASTKHRRVDPFFSGAPSTFVEPGIDGRFIFSRQIAKKICALKAAISEVRNRNTRRLFKVLLASTAISVSNVLISGKGRRYRRNWQHRPISPEAVDTSFEQHVLRAIFDLRRHEERPCKEYNILRGDARVLIKDIEQADLAVFSPPYPNSFDYTDVYNVELWTLGYLSTTSANRRLRESTLRSHVQINRDFSADAGYSPTLQRTLRRLHGMRATLWNPNIPSMINAYFSDMRTVLSELQRKTAPNGYLYIVVGDSRYAGVNIPVATIIAEDAPHLGLKVCSLEPFRSMRVSPQQGGKKQLTETLVILQRP